MMIVVGIVIVIAAEASARARLMYVGPLIAAVTVLIVSVLAHKRG